MAEGPRTNSSAKRTLSVPSPPDAQTGKRLLVTVAVKVTVARVTVDVLTFSRVVLTPPVSSMRYVRLGLKPSGAQAETVMGTVEASVTRTPAPAAVLPLALEVTTALEL